MEVRSLSSLIQLHIQEIEAGRHLKVRFLTQIKSKALSITPGPWQGCCLLTFSQTLTRLVFLMRSSYTNLIFPSAIQCPLNTQRDREQMENPHPWNSSPLLLPWPALPDQRSIGVLTRIAILSSFGIIKYIWTRVED